MKSDGERPKRRTKRAPRAAKPGNAKAKQRAEQVLRGYRKAFRGFTKAERMILDGIIPVHSGGQ
jgi:hypothetical protein